MKNNVSKLFCGIIAAIALTTAGYSQITPVAQPSAEQIADAYANVPVAYWQGSYNFIGTPTNGVPTSYQAFVTFQPSLGRWGITQLRIGNVEYPIDPKFPLAEIPAFNGLVTAFNAQLTGYNSQNVAVRGAGLSLNRLSPGDDIVFNLYLYYVTVTIQHSLTGDHAGANTSIQSSDGLYSGYYDDYRHEFVVSYDPLRPPTAWVLIDTRNNSVFDAIPFTPVGGGNQPSDSAHGFSFLLPDGTLEAMLTPDISVLPLSGFVLDQDIDRSGTHANGKIILAHLQNPNNFVQVFASGLRSGSKVEVFGLQTDKQMVLISTQSVTNDLGYSIVFNNLTGYRTYKVVMSGNLLSPVGGASLTLYWSQYSWGTYGKDVAPAIIVEQ